MIKHINHQNFLTTPFVAIKAWELLNVANNDVVFPEILFIFFHGNPLYSYSNERCMILYRNTVLQVCRPDTLLHFQKLVSNINYPSLDTRNHF